MRLRSFACLALVLALSACATTTPPEVRETPERPAEADFALSPASFADLPGWSSADLAPALTAFRRSCDGRRLRDPTAPLANGARYGGTVADWASACAAAQNVAPGGERQFFETYFMPHAVRSSGEARLTAYFEPIIQARRAPEGMFTEPLLRPPSDMVSIDLAAFAEAYDNEALRGAPRRLTGQLNGNEVRPYPQRG